MERVNGGVKLVDFDTLKITTDAHDDAQLKATMKVDGKRVDAGLISYDPKSRKLVFASNCEIMKEPGIFGASFSVMLHEEFEPSYKEPRKSVKLTIEGTHGGMVAEPFRNFGFDLGKLTKNFQRAINEDKPAVEWIERHMDESPFPNQFRQFKPK